MSDPFKPLEASIKYGNTTVGGGIISASGLDFALDVDEYYGIGGGGEPSLVKGHRHYRGTLRKAWLDLTFLEDAMAGYVCDIVFTPTAGFTITVENAIIRVYGITMDEDAVLAESIDFIGDGIDVSP